MTRREEGPETALTQHNALKFCKTQGKVQKRIVFPDGALKFLGKKGNLQKNKVLLANPKSKETKETDQLDSLWDASGRQGPHEFPTTLSASRNSIAGQFLGWHLVAVWISGVWNVQCPESEKYSERLKSAGYP